MPWPASERRGTRAPVRLGPYRTGATRPPSPCAPDFETRQRMTRFMFGSARAKDLDVDWRWPRGWRLIRNLDQAAQHGSGCQLSFSGTTRSDLLSCSTELCARIRGVVVEPWFEATVGVHELGVRRSRSLRVGPGRDCGSTARRRSARRRRSRRRCRRPRRRRWRHRPRSPRRPGCAGSPARPRRRRRSAAAGRSWPPRRSRRRRRSAMPFSMNARSPV